MAKEIIITGSPRTGTSALCSLLYHSEGVMIANEVSAYHRNKNALKGTAVSINEKGGLLKTLPTTCLGTLKIRT